MTAEKLNETADRLVEETVTFLLEQDNQQANWILYTHYAADELEDPATKIAKQNAKLALKHLDELSDQETVNDLIQNNQSSSILPA